MSVAKNIEITSTSETSFEDAIQKGIAKASETIKGISGAWIKEQKIAVENNNITRFTVAMIITFVLSDKANVDE